MAAAQATAWHAMGGAAADDFRRENYIIAGMVVYLGNLAFCNFQDEDGDNSTEKWAFNSSSIPAGRGYALVLDNASSTTEMEQTQE